MREKDASSNPADFTSTSRFVALHDDDTIDELVAAGEMSAPWVYNASAAVMPTKTVSAYTREWESVFQNPGGDGNPSSFIFSA